MTQEEKEHLYSPSSTKGTEFALIILSIKKLLVQKMSVVNPFTHAKNRRSLDLDNMDSYSERQKEDNCPTLYEVSIT